MPDASLAPPARGFPEARPARRRAFLLLGLFVLALGARVAVFRAQRAWRGPAVAGAIALLVMSPYLLHLRGATGGWTVVGKTSWVYAMGVAQYRVPGEPIERSVLEATRDEVGSPWGHLRASPEEAVGGYLFRSRRLLVELARAANPVLAAVAACGLVALVRRRRPTAAFLLALSPLTVVPVAAVAARHALPYLPVLAGLAASFGIVVWDLATGRRAPSGQ